VSEREHFDVLIIGAGLSGVGAACHLQAKCPGKTFALLEARSAIGGTWDLFRYPGIRSDSDMYTLGYSFRPWEHPKAIADGDAILDYIRDTARDHGVEPAIRFNHRVVRGEWSSEDARWTLDVERSDSGETLQMTCGFVFACTGYYRYDEGFTPPLPGIESFGGEVIHPQHWPEDLDYAGKRVVVIGSGATAMTLVPAMAERAAHVTMLQRSPGYVLSRPSRDVVADVLRRLLPSRAAYALARWKNVLLTSAFFQLSRRRPRWVKAAIRRDVQRRLPEGYATDPDFRPRYDPWDQRVCLVPDGDLFEALHRGDVSIVTDKIETFTRDGIVLVSGKRLEADIVVTATGLNLLALGGMEVVVDGEPVDISKVVGYKGFMFSGIPNAAVALGYTNASWTLKCDLTCEHVCRLLNHMDEHGYVQATPRWTEPELPDNPFIDLVSGYVLRSIDKFPKQGDSTPWRLHQNYARDIALLKHGPVTDPALELKRAPAAQTRTRRAYSAA
jgi:monooxygenase